jgi:hypothetical protein
MIGIAGSSIFTFKCIPRFFAVVFIATMDDGSAAKFVPLSDNYNISELKTRMISFKGTHFLKDIIGVVQSSAEEGNTFCGS